MNIIITVFISVLLPFLLIGRSFAEGIAPQVIMQLDNDKAIQLKIGSNEGDCSYMDMMFNNNPILTAEHDVITVSFDIYRDSIDGFQQLGWGWLDENGESTYFSSRFYPSIGMEEYYLEPLTYPLFLFPQSPEVVGKTAIDQWANVTMVWDFKNKVASASYNGDEIIVDIPMKNIVDKLFGWEIFLYNQGAYHAIPGNDLALIDNFVITGSDIYNSNGFESFILGNLNGQEGWLAGAESGPAPPVPEPSTVLLLVTGLLCLAGVSRNVRK